MHAQEQTGLVLHLCFDVQEAAVANPSYAVAFITLLPEEMVSAKSQSWKLQPSHRAEHRAAIRGSPFEDGCALFQVTGLRHTRAPKDNHQLGNGVSRFTGDVNH